MHLIPALLSVYSIYTLLARKHLDLLHVKNKQLPHNTIKIKFLLYEYGYLGWMDEQMMTMIMGSQIVKSMLNSDEAKTRRDGIALLL